MEPQEFEKLLRRKANELKVYTESYFPSRAGNIALRFVNGNFRAQGWQGTTFKRWKPNQRNKTILVKTGKMRAATYFTSQHGQFTLKNPMPYARKHNEGWRGTVNVAAHTRNVYRKTKVGTGKFTKTGKERKKNVNQKVGQRTVRAHERKVNIPRRQFIPTYSSRSSVLDNAILRMLARDINKIMNIK